MLICTDLAARGLDMDHVEHVIQFEVAGDSVTYLHRIGRTARSVSLTVLVSRWCVCVCVHVRVRV